MKLCTFTRRLPDGSASAPTLGVVDPAQPHLLIDARALAEAANSPQHRSFASLQGLLDAGPEAFAHLRQLLQSPASEAAPRLPIQDVQLLAPLPRPSSLRDCMAFEQHYQQAIWGAVALELPLVSRLDAWFRRLFHLSFLRVPALFRELPAYYKGNPRTVVGPDATVTWPPYSRLLDYELEVAVVLHRQGTSCSPAEAAQLIAGYVLFNDFSARDAQLKEMKLRLGPAKGKDFDTGNAMGPFLVTPDEVGDLRQLRAEARINGEVWTRSDLSAMAFSVEEIVSYISQSETLYPGDVIGLGTVPNGCGLEHGRWLKPGDVVELEVQPLGILRNRVVKA